MINSRSYTPVIILGAPRSGTNMLRDVMCEIEGIATWPCDEINYIWRHGNIRYPSDEIPSHMATQALQAYVRKQFDWVRKRYKSNIVVEKTCANCLRVPFIDKVVNDAKYVFIYRDGIDASSSAKLRWKAELDLQYMLRKLRFVPVGDIPYYGIKFLGNRLYRLVSPDKRLAFWGPKLDNMQKILEIYTLNEVCALQWKQCVDKADNSLSMMPSEKVLRICYENFVRSPEDGLASILDFINIEANDEVIANAVSGVSSKSIGKGRSLLNEEEVLRLEQLVGDTLNRYGYRG